MTVSQRTDAKILMHIQPEGAHAPRVDEEHIEVEIIPVASQPGPREPSQDEIEKHDVLHDPAMPWCDVCIQSKSRDDFHRRARQKVLPVIQFDYAVVGIYQGQPHFISRLEPTCTVTSVTPITETPSVEMNTVNSFQHHRLAAYGGNLRTTTMKTGIDMSPSNSIDVSAKIQTVEQIADVPLCDDDTNASMRKAIENDAAQMKSTGDDIALLGKRHRIIRREVGSSECKEEAADCKSEAESVEVGDTLKRAIFELTEREDDQSPVSSKRHARPPVTPRAQESCGVKGVSMVSVAQCAVLTALYTSCSLLHE